ncbi:MAG: hypothetical protein ACOX63_09525 [Christensenellales bacterium]|jgi:hypothetical protein
MKGRLKDLTIGLNGEQNITVSVLGDFREEYRKLKDQPVDVLIKKHRSLRSLDANAYAWVLITKLAESMQPPLSKEEVYRLMLQRYGQGGVISVQTEKLASVKRAFDYWEEKGTGTVNGKEFSHLHVWVGSSKYDTKEMAMFIDGIIAECKELGIETDTPEQIRQFKERWAGK